jgi:Domain of unknown function (DUF6456)
MDKLTKPPSLLKAEMASVIIYLSQGAANIEVKSASLFILSRTASNPLQVSAQAIAYLARKNWVKRDGKLLSITERAASAHLNSSTLRETDDVRLVENGRSITVKRVTVESPIDYLASRKDKNGVPLLGKEEWVAGDRLRTDFTRANMLPGISMRWGEPIRVSGGAGGNAMQTDMAMAARKRVAKALEAVGPEFSGLLLDVCCFLKGLEQVEIERKWPQRSAKLMLRAGLSILARHYTPPGKVDAKIRAWGTEDYRPSL